MVAIGIAYLLIKAGWITVNTEGTFLLLVLVFGAGTDYSLLLVHRYREELQRGVPAGGGAAARRCARACRPIAASGGTVIAAMLVLLVADLESTHWLGPILAIGIAVMLLPRLHPAAGAARGARRARLLAGRGRPARRGARGRWDAIAGFVRRRSRPIIVLVIAGLLVLALGNLVHHGTIGFGQGETDADQLEPRHQGAERTLPARARLAADRGRPGRRSGAGRRGMEEPRLGPAGDAGAAARRARADAVVARSSPATPTPAKPPTTVEEIRERLHEIAPTGLLGGIPAENYDDRADQRAATPA